MSRKIQPSSRFTKAVNIITVLRFLWKHYRSLSQKLEKAKVRQVPRSVLEAYKSNKPIIEQIYGRGDLRRGLLYHGTGALQYDGAKYGAGVTSDLRRPLDTILKHGLRPHTDPWALTEGSNLSISFATAWSYAKFYADVNQSSDDPLEWEYGKSEDWFSYFIADTARQTFKKASLVGSLRKELGILRQTREQNINSYNRLQRWALDVRSDITLQTSPLEVICSRTDIPDNFGVIITVSEDNLLLAPMELGGTYEKRAARSVGPAKFTSLTVPLGKVEEYAAKVHNLGYSFPVLPTEAVEYHMSHFPMQELTHAHRVE